MTESARKDIEITEPKGKEIIVCNIVIIPQDLSRKEIIGVLKTLDGIRRKLVPLLDKTA